MLNPATGLRPALLSFLPWAADNGCYAAGESFDVSRWLQWLQRLVPFRSNSLFVVAPDVVADARATLARATPILPVLRERGWTPAYVLQDGQEDFAPPWKEFGCAFVGGSTEWKLSEDAASLCAEARRRGKWVHMGRCNSRRRLLHAAGIGCHSVDGTYLAFGPDRNLPRLEGWLRERNEQVCLPLWEGL